MKEHSGENDNTEDVDRRSYSENEDDSESSTSSSSSEDEDTVPPDIFGKDFFKTLSSLKAKDPSIYNANVRFFENQNSEELTSKPAKSSKNEGSKSDKPLLLRDYERDLILNKKDVFEEDETTAEDIPPVTTIVESERQLKNEFKNFLKDDDDLEEEEFGGLLKKKVKTKKEQEKEDDDYMLWLKGQKDMLDDKTVESELKPLHDYWNNKNLDSNEEFLKDFILNKRFLEENNDSGGDEDENILSEDEKVLIAQDEFEEKYNFRFENQDVSDVKRYPRQVEGSLRRKDDRRKRKRIEIRERKKAEKEKKNEKIKKQQKEKLKEIENKLEELKKLTGNERLGFDNEDILEDFDPDKHDQKMQEMYNDEFYMGADEEKPQFEDEDYGEDWKYENEEGYGEEINCEDPEFNMDCEAIDGSGDYGKSKNLTRKKRKKREKKKRGFTEVSQLERPLYDPLVHQSFQKYVDEYYNLDCEDFIDDLPCRYKYKTVQSNDYGLTIEEILAADDKELNKWCPLSKLYKTRSQHVEANEVKIYKKKASNIEMKKRILPSLFESEEQKEPEDEEEYVEDSLAVGSNEGEVCHIGDKPVESGKSSKRKRKDSGKWNKSHPGNGIKDHGGNNKRKKWAPSNNGNSSKQPEFSDVRLSAYGIKPKRFQKFGKFKAKQPQN
ncbi:hypothetical protein AAG570_011053 [Ranatra chinensis]|uniref:Protein KRI1 homolog n=1 Tax=Ranatra chinensis TaxID=642074 RepID=A0ABD0YJS2_9HEMI